MAEEPPNDFRTVREFPFSFNHRQFTVAYCTDRWLWVPLPLLCQAISIDENGQKQRVERDPVFTRKVATRFVHFNLYPYGNEGQTRPRDAFAIRIDMLPFFLGGIDTNRITSEVDRETIIAYQMDFSEVTWAAYRSHIIGDDELAEMDVALPPEQQEYHRMMDAAARQRQKIQDQLALIDGQMDEHGHQIAQIGERVAALEAKLMATDALNAAQMKRVDDMIAAAAKALAAKKIKDPYGTVYRSIKSAFKVHSHAQIKEGDFPALVKFLAQIYRNNTRPGTPLPSIFEAADQHRLF